MREPGHYKDYPSTMCSPYYCWFKDRGYHELDIVQYGDGEFSIIQYLQTPLFPSLTRWQHVLTGLRNIEINPSNIFRLVDQLDLEKREVWAEQERLERRTLELEKEREERTQEFAARAFKVIRGNDRIMQTVAKTGQMRHALDLGEIARHIPLATLKGL